MYKRQVYYWCRGLIGFNKSMEAIPNGFIQMISPILILCFAWTLCGLCLLYTSFRHGSQRPQALVAGGDAQGPSPQRRQHVRLVRQQTPGDQRHRQLDVYKRQGDGQP